MSLVHNGEDIDSKSAPLLDCYTLKKGGGLNGQFIQTPDALGAQPIPTFPKGWTPQKDNKGNYKFASKNPFNLANFTRRVKAGEKVAQSLKEWGLTEKDPAKSQKISKLAHRVNRCQNISTCIGQDGAPVGGANGGAYFRSERCNSRFCPRCAKKCAKATMKRLCKRIGMDPKNPPDGLRFLTLTLPGGAGVPLEKRTKRLRLALTRLYKTTLWREKVEGSIGKIEVTLNGENWHAHAHFLLCGDYIENNALRSVWAECLKVDYSKINLPWITKPQKGKNSIKEICKYVAKPVAFLGSKNGKEWTQAQMEEFFNCFLNARVFMTTGIYTGKENASSSEKTQEKQSDALLADFPNLTHKAQTGDDGAINKLVEIAKKRGIPEKDILYEIAAFYFCPSSDPPTLLGEWTTNRDKIESARIEQALWWERSQRFWCEMHRARDECLEALGVSL